MLTKWVKSLLFLLLIFNIVAVYAVPKPGCVNLKNSTLTAEAVLSPVFNPGPTQTVPVKIVISDVRKADSDGDTVRYYLDGTINGANLVGSYCYDRVIDSVITWVIFVDLNGKFAIKSQSFTSNDPSFLTVPQTLFVWHAPDGTLYANNDKPVILTK